MVLHSYNANIVVVWPKIQRGAENVESRAKLGNTS